MYKFISSSMLIFFTVILTGQSGFLTSGGDTSNSSGSVSLSIGQIITTSFNNTVAKVTSGVQQPFEINEIVSSQDIHIPYNILVYPNPFFDEITVSVPSNKLSDEIEITCISSENKLIFKNLMPSEDFKFNVSQLPPGSYVLYLKNKFNQKKSFILVKP